MAFLYPWGNTQQLNLDWILQKIKELETGGGAGAVLEEVANALITLTHRSTTQYRRWDYCFYNGKLYRALVDTTGAFAPADWREVVLGDDVSVLTRLINALDTDNIDNASNVSGNTASDALNNLNDAISNTVKIVNGKNTGLNTLDNIVNYALAQITAGKTSYGKLFTFRTNNGSGSDPDEYFGNSRVCVICNFHQEQYGCGLLLSDSTKNIAAFIRRGGVNTLYPIGDLNDAINSKAPINSPTFTGTPTAPTAAVGTNTTQIATTQFVQNEQTNRIYYKLLANGASVSLPVTAGHCYLIYAVRVATLGQTYGCWMIDSWGGIVTINNINNITVTYADNVATVTNNSGGYVNIPIFDLYEA